MKKLLFLLLITISAQARNFNVHEDYGITAIHDRLRSGDVVNITRSIQDHFIVVDGVKYVIDIRHSVFYNGNDGFATVSDDGQNVSCTIIGQIVRNYGTPKACAGQFSGGGHIRLTQAMFCGYPNINALEVSGGTVINDANSSDTIWTESVRGYGLVISGYNTIVNYKGGIFSDYASCVQISEGTLNIGGTTIKTLYQAQNVSQYSFVDAGADVTIHLLSDCIINRQYTSFIHFDGAGHLIVQP